MIEILHGAKRGHTRWDWLDSRHSFSFGDWYEPSRMGFRALRVLNEDRIAPASGFGPHPHRDMEILTFPIEGLLEHRDSEGNVGRLEPGRVQLMHAGHGIVHSELNPDPQRTTHLLQIWLLPARRGARPGWSETRLVGEPGVLEPLATPGGAGGGLPLEQDASIHALRLEAGAEFAHTLAAGRHGFVQIARGAGRLGEQTIEAGDGAMLSGERVLRLVAGPPGLEALIFDLA